MMIDRKILVGIPVLYNGDTCLKAFRSVINEADLLIIDNGSDASCDASISAIMHEAREVGRLVFLIRHGHNIFVNPAWNEILKFFSAGAKYDQLVIMNSDLIMQPGWSNALVDGLSCIPTDGSHLQDVEVTEGTPGVFIHLNKGMAALVYPVPTPPLVWFGDQYIYTRLRKAGFKTVIRAGLVGQHYHGGSQTVQRVPGISEIIEQDKKAWAEIEKSL